MNKKKKSKIDVLLERGAKEYADKILSIAKQQMKEQGVEMTAGMEKSMYDLTKNAFISGEDYMFRILLQEQTKKPH